jgi:hypothetical protein
MYRPLFIALAAAGMFLLAMISPRSVAAAFGPHGIEDQSVREELVNRVGAGKRVPPDLVLVLCANNSRQARWLKEHDRSLRKEAMNRFSQAGLTVAFVSCEAVDSELMTRMEKSPRLADDRRSGNLGVVRVDFSDDSVTFDGVSFPVLAPWQALEYTNHGRVTILMGHLGSRFGSASCDQTCSVVNLLCHGTGHAIGLSDPGHVVPYFPFSFPEFVRTWLLRQPPDVMMQAQPFDLAPLSYNMNNNHNRSAIDRLKNKERRAQ